MSDMQGSPTKVRFEHGFITELGMHRNTSPDRCGFHIMGKIYEEAEREALNTIVLIQSHWTTERPGKISTVEFEAAYAVIFCFPSMAFDAPPTAKRFDFRLTFPHPEPGPKGRVEGRRRPPRGSGPLLRPSTRPFGPAQDEGG